MLMEALARLLTKKEFEDVSVQEIADEATLNRATFYLRTRHFPRPPLPGPFLEPHAAGSRLPIASPRKRWQPGLKPW